MEGDYLMHSWVNYTVFALLGTGILGIAGELPSISMEEDAGLPGITRPSQQAVIYPNVAGVVQELLVEEGALVREGQPLVRMHDRVAMATLAAAEVAATQLGPIDLARAELAAAQQHMQRLESVTDLRAIAAQDFEIARAAIEKARANLSTAEGNLQLAKERLAIERERVSELTLSAPFDGVVYRIKANVGERLQENQSVLEVVNTTTLKVEVHVPSATQSELQIGSVYPLKTSFRDLRSIEAKLTSVAPMIDPSTNTIRCMFEIENRAENLPAGFLVHFDNH
jgi:RND family efflux transporter MFP subunit